MNDIISVIKSLVDVIHGKEQSEKEIIKAEVDLGLKFSDDYRTYIKKFGCMSIGSHEFTGISTQEHYSVVSVTTAQRQYNKDVPKCWYVIEQLDIDGIVIWQSTDGTVYLTYANSPFEKIADSLSEYIVSL